MARLARKQHAQGTSTGLRQTENPQVEPAVHLKPSQDAHLGTIPKTADTRRGIREGESDDTSN